MRPPGTLILAAIVAATAVLQPTAAQAAEAGGIGIYPVGNAGGAAPWFQYRLDRGASLTDSLTVANRSYQPADVLLYPVDAAPTGDGSFGMMPEAARLSDAGSWIRLTPRTLHLEPDSIQTIPFEFSVPLSASVGPHYAGIVVQPVQSAVTSSSSLSLNVISRVGVRLYETVPGAAHPRLTIEGFRHTNTHGRISLVMSLRNTGNTITVPAGQMKITGLFGRQAETLPVSTGHSLQPGQSLARSLPTTLNAGSWPQRYTVRLQLSDSAAGGANTATTTISFWTGNILLAIARVLTVLLLLLIVGALAWRKTRPKPS